MADQPRRTLRLDRLLAATATPPRAKWLDEPQAPRVPISLADVANTYPTPSRPARADQARTPQGQRAYQQLLQIDKQVSDAVRMTRQRMPTIVSDELRTPKAAAAERGQVAGAHFGSLAAAAKSARLIADEARGASYQLAFRLARRLEDQSPARVAQLAEIRRDLRDLSKADRERVIIAAVQQGDVDVLESIASQPPTIAGDPIAGLALGLTGYTTNDIVQRLVAEVEPDLAAAYGELHALARAAGSAIAWSADQVAQESGFRAPVELDAAIADIGSGPIGGNEWTRTVDRRAEAAAKARAAEGKDPLVLEPTTPPADKVPPADEPHPDPVVRAARENLQRMVDIGARIDAAAGVAK